MTLRAQAAAVTAALAEAGRPDLQCRVSIHDGTDIAIFPLSSADDDETHRVAWKAFAVAGMRALACFECWRSGPPASFECVDDNCVHGNGPVRYSRTEADA